MNRWLVWFKDHEQPIDVETEEHAHMFAVGVAMDMLGMDAVTTPHLLKVERVTDRGTVQTWPATRPTKAMYHWNVWFIGRAEPCKVVTETSIPMHAVATAIDVLGLGKRERLSLSKVELVDPEDLQ
jgi:hypothetical protein